MQEKKIEPNNDTDRSFFPAINLIKLDEISMSVYEKPRIILYIIKMMVSTFQNRFCQYF